jgi:acetyl esterase/lipase
MNRFTRRISAGLSTAALLLGGFTVAQELRAQEESMAAAQLMAWPDLLSRPLPKATKRISFGTEAHQFADLWLPEGEGPFPVVLMVHGGCWQTDIADLSIMNYISEDLRTRGIAVWNIEYRGVDRPGGGYPGSFQDVAAAADALRTFGKEYPLKLNRIVALGHSAGGHLAFWLAARQDLPKDSPLRTKKPLRLASAISIGGLPDLEATLTRQDNVCEAAPIIAMTGEASPERPNIYADTSPAALPANKVRQIVINGDHDRVAPPRTAFAYKALMTGKGQKLREVIVPNTGHVELIAPGTAAWSQIVGAIEGEFKRK